MPVILWLLGVPLGLIIVLALVGVFWGLADDDQQTGWWRRSKGHRPRSQLKGKLQDKAAWTKRSKENERFMDVKKSSKKFEGVRKEKKTA